MGLQLFQNILFFKNLSLPLCDYWDSHLKLIINGVNTSVSSLQGLVMAGLADMTRPADKLSTSQSAVLTATGETTPKLKSTS